MNDRLFDAPVFVKSEKDSIKEIAGIADAIDLLDEWPLDRRDLVHETVLRACHSALDGQKPLETAQRALVGFARKAGILEDVTVVMA
ncbi:MAG TPA: DUF982 domain-containing protein [Pararhizobium sp.]|nr:DUF982 domain-containing protein [Pararhizobium sp.]